MKREIESPYGNGKALLKYEITKEVFRKEEFRIRKFYYKCQISGQEFTTTEAGDLNITQLYNLYRERKNILFPEEIKKMREDYGLSAAKMSEVLGFGVNTYSNYEKGEIPNDSNATLLNQVYKPENFLAIIEEKQKLFREKQYKELVTRINKQIRDNKGVKLFKSIFSIKSKPDEYTGYRLPNLEKAANVVLYFLDQKYTYITRLNKYLFYADFLNFSRTGYSITGLNYGAIDMGPVPNLYNLLYGMMDSERYIKYSYDFQHDKELPKYIPLKKFNSELFTEQETETLKTVLKKFRFEKTGKIIEISHDEDAWKKNVKKKATISYMEYGFDLKAF